MTNMNTWPAAPVPAPEPKQKRVHWAVVVLVGTVCFMLGASCGTMASTTRAANAAPEPATRSAPTYSPPIYRPPATTVAPVAEPRTSFGDGTWIVGRDIQPGTYRSPGATPGFFEFCSATTRSGAASNSDMIDWVTANANEPVVIEIGEGVKALDVHGCEPFVRDDG